MKSSFKLSIMLVFFLFFTAHLIADTWTQSTKAAFNQGTHEKTYAVNATGTNGDVQLSTTIYNGWFDEDNGSYDGWEDASMGDGILLTEVINGGGRTSVSHNYTTYGTEASWAKRRQWVLNDLDNLSRFHLDVYPISSECNGTAKLKLRVQAYDTLDNPMLDTDVPANEIEYILYGTPHPSSTFDWHERTYEDSWNYFIWNMKEHIIYFLSGGYTWSDVYYIKLTFESYSGETTGSTCGAYWDSFWAAYFVEDNFNDNYLDPTMWIEHDRDNGGSQIYIDEVGEELKFHGTSYLPYWHWTYVKTQELINHTDHQFTESSLKVRLKNFSALESVFMFMFEDNDEQNHFRLIAQPGIGYKYGWRIDGIWYESTDIIPFLGIESSNFLTWRIIYDDDTETAYGLISGTLIGMQNVSLNNYRVKICHDIEYSGQYFDMRVDDFSLIKYDYGEYENKYSTEGTFISSAYDTEYKSTDGAGFDQLSWNYTGDTIKFQLRSAEIEDDIQFATWYGPENDPDGWYGTPGAINPVHNNDKWIQYKTKLSTADQKITPYLHDVSISYHDAVGITFTFDNIELTNEGNFFEFDIMANATDNGTKHGIIRNYINYNINGFGNNIIANGYADITKGTLLEGEVPGFPGEPLYILNLGDQSNSCFFAKADLNPLAFPSLANDLPTIPSQLFHVIIEIQDEEQTSDLSFQRVLMNNQQFYSNMTTLYTPTVSNDSVNSYLTCVPQDIQIIIKVGMIRMNWAEVPGASYYNIYSTTTPYDQNSWKLEDTGILIPYWTKPVEGDKKFFTVTAICD